MKNETQLIEISPKLPVFLRVFFAIFFLSIAVSVLISYAMPVTYSTRILLSWLGGGGDPSTNAALALEFTTSDSVMTRLAELANGTSRERMSAHDLRLRVSSATRDESLIELQAYGHRASEAAELCEMWAQACMDASDRTAQAGRKVSFRIVDRREPVRVRPNKPRNTGIGALAGIVLGALGGGGVVQLRRRIEARGRRRAL
ncbi:MAG TPA: hypothetical protein VEH04_05630 [Verrucomicrobiae bacterium]|nr:hypothetical protein [Verrucomicrobiae bacterium]